jgi:hypothetical protein
MIGVVGALLFGNLTGARADTTAEPPAAEPTTSDPGIANHTVTFRPRTDPQGAEHRRQLPHRAALPRPRAEVPRAMTLLTSRH